MRQLKLPEGQHVIERIDQKADFVVRILQGSRRIIFPDRNGITACWMNRSSTVGMPNFRTPPSGLGILFRLSGILASASRMESRHVLSSYKTCGVNRREGIEAWRESVHFVFRGLGTSTQ
jgi:hypothetical protein